MDAQTFLDNFGTIAQAPGGIDQLRELIRQLAVRGRITDQDRDDESATELLNRIDAERSARIKNNKLRPQKRMTTLVTPDDCPTGWVAVRLGDIFDLEYGKSLAKSNRVEDGEIPVYGSNGVVGSHDVALVEQAAVVIGRKGSSGAVNTCYGPSWPIDTTYFVTPYGGMTVDFSALVLQAAHLEEIQRATAIPGLNRDDAYARATWLPPLAEQHRIVAKVDELMALCDQLETQQQTRTQTTTKLRTSALNALTTAKTADDLQTAWQRIHTNWGALSADVQGMDGLRQLILNLAVRGRLVEEEPGDEPVEDLLESISTNRSRLVADGLIKVDKQASPGTSATNPFELPARWRWIRLADFAYLEMGQSPPGSTYNDKEEGLPFFQGKADFTDNHPIPSTWCTQPKKIAQAGDVLISIRAPIGPTNLAIEESCIGRGLAVLRPLGGVPSRYLRIVIDASRAALEALGTGTTFKAISRKNLAPFLLPVPPLAEQQRIVAKVDELMALCDELESRLVERDQVGEALAASVADAFTA